MIDIAICKLWCLAGLIGYALVSAWIILFVHGATKNSKELEGTNE